MKVSVVIALALLIGMVGLTSQPRTSMPGSDARIAAAAMNRFDEIPKGVVLEGDGMGIEELTSLTYDKEKNEFTINEKMKYKNPVDRKEFAQLLKALKEDDRIGVTLLEGQIKTYGKLGSSSAIIGALTETDKILGGLIYGIDHLLEGIKLPGGYKPKKAGERKIPVVAFSTFNRYVFEKRSDTYVRAGVSIDVTLIPLSDKKSDSGGHMPDEAKMKEYTMEDSDRSNLDHLHAFQGEYLKMPSFAKAADAGEAAAFARHVRDSKIDLEVFIKTMK
jgi:hypothetical protein